MPRKQINKQGIKLYFFAVTLIIVAVIVAIIILKYYVEGEKNIPFNISDITIITTAETQNMSIQENEYIADVIQKNDIFITIEKNTRYNKEDAIEKISFKNFIINQNKNYGIVGAYRPSKSDNKNFEYIDEYLIKDKLEYIGSDENNFKEENLLIGNQGGTLFFSIATKNLGQIKYQKNENLKIDGSLLKKMNLKEDDIELDISFDVIIKLQSGKQYKTNIKLKPNIKEELNDGITTLKLDTKKLIFKRQFN